MTLIKNATIKRSYQTAKGTDLIALGTESGHDSMSIDLGNLKLWMGSITNKISEGDSYVQVIDNGKGMVEIAIDHTTFLTFVGAVIKPHIDNYLDLGTTTNRFKDLHLAGAVNLGSDMKGDIYYRDNDNHFTRLAIGSNGRVLRSNGQYPYWSDSTESVTNVGNILLTANTPTTIQFTNILNGNDNDVVLLNNAYDDNGNPVAVTITSITTSSFTAEASTNAVLHYQASMKSI